MRGFQSRAPDILGAFFVREMGPVRDTKTYWIDINKK